VGVKHAERLPAYQLVAASLRAQITSGRLRPGDRLPAEPQLCDRAGVSRSTVREALRLLASEHLIVTTRGVTGGSFVSQPSPGQLADTLSASLRLLIATGQVDMAQIVEVRAAIEVPAAGLAAQRRTDEDLAALRATLGDSQTAGLEAMLAAHRSFHLTLATAAGNPLVEVMLRPLYSVTNERAMPGPAPAGFWRCVDEEHRSILQAVAAQDPAAARAAAYSHAQHACDLHASRAYG